MIGMAILVGISLIAISIAQYFRFQGERHHILYEQALKVADPVEMKYGIDTGVGDILAYGPLTADKPQSVPEIKGTYAQVDRIEERYTEHTYTTCSSNGKSTSCSTHTYWSWDFAGEQDHHSVSYSILGSSIPNVCAPSGTYADLSKTYQGNDKHNGTYAYPGGFFSNTRYYWDVSPVIHTGSVFVRAISDKLTDPEGGSCVPYLDGKNIQQAVDSSVPDNGLTAFLCVGLVILITGIWFAIAWTEDL